MFSKWVTLLFSLKNIGSIGNKFYIILKGTVSVLVPKKRQISKLSPEEEEKLNSEENEQFNFCPREVQDKVSNFFEFIALGRLQPVSICNYVDDGKSFGEIALMSNKPRGASILCKEDTHFAVMNRDDFRDTLMKLEENVMNSYIDFLSKILEIICIDQTVLFKSWGNSVLYKLLFAIDKISYKRHEVVYNQNDTANAFFIVYKGEFTMHK